jgi:hypothetical protein
MPDSLQHQFEISTVPFTASVDVFENIRKRKERIVYSAQTQPDNINLAFLDVKAVNSDRNMFLSDRSGSIPANKIQVTDPITFTSTSYSIETNSFLLTDISILINAANIPLFYKHLISTDRYTPGTDQILYMTALDKSFAPIPTANANVSQIKLMDTAHEGVLMGAVFNNLVNTYDGLTGTSEVFYLRYAVQRAGNISVYVDILNNLPVYQEATFDDLDSSNNIKSNRKVYVIEEETGHFLISQLPAATTFYLLQPDKRRIEVRLPPTRSASEDWTIKTTNGQFFASLFNNPSITAKYAIAEFLDQLFTPFPPYKNVVQEFPIDLGGTLYKVANEHLVIDPNQDFQVVVDILNEDDSLFASYSTAVPGVGIRSIDTLGGFIDLYERPISTRRVRVSYTYEEKEYQLGDVNLNPAFNISAPEETLVVYLVPQTSPRDRTLFYLRLDTLGKVLFSSEAQYGDDHGIRLRAEGFDVNGNASVSSTFTYSQFIDRYTVETTLVNSDPLWTVNPGFILLGEVYIGEASSINDIGTVDIRRRGGGFKVEKRQEVLERNFESSWNWDIGHWDGLPFPGNCSYFIEVPSSLLKAVGGKFDLPDIRTAVEEHTALGVYPIVKSYGPDPVINSVSISDTSVILNWTDRGPSMLYSIYQGLSPTGPFSQIATNIPGTTYTATGLTTQTAYWFFVTGIENGVDSIGSSGPYTLGVKTR